MNTRRTKLEKALAFNIWFFNKNVLLYNNDVIDDAEKHHEKHLGPLHAALIEAIENLEDIQAWCRDRDASKAILYAVWLSRSTEALAKIDKALGEG